MKKTQRVRVWPKQGLTDVALDAIFVKYKRKKWRLSELLEFLAEEAEHKCNVETACLFKAREYVEGLALSEIEKMELELIEWE